LNDHGEWKCEDHCLTSRNHEFCGETEHFTNFAVLFQGIADGGCNETTNYVLAWISLAFVSIALIFILLTILVIELWYRRKNYNETEEFDRLSRTVATTLKD